MLLDQFADFMILVLIAAAVVSGIVGEPSDTIAIFVIVLLNAVIGFVQEWRAERAMAALRLMAAPSARGAPRRRRGDAAGRPAGAGRHRAAGGRQRGAGRPAPDRGGAAARAEAALTGESQPVEKHARGPAPRRSCRSATAQHGLEGHAGGQRPRCRGWSSPPGSPPNSAASRGCSKAPRK
jgi:Ca2+-transporting ATPase